MVQVPLWDRFDSDELELSAEQIYKHTTGNWAVINVQQYLSYTVWRTWYFVSVLPWDAYRNGITAAYRKFLVYVPPDLVHPFKKHEYDEDSKYQLSRWKDLDDIMLVPSLERSRQLDFLRRYKSAKSEQIVKICKTRNDLLSTEHSPPVTYQMYDTRANPGNAWTTVRTLGAPDDLLADLLSDEGRRSFSNYGLLRIQIREEIDECETRMRELQEDIRVACKWYKKEHKQEMAYAYKRRREHLSCWRDTPDKFPCRFNAYCLVQCRIRGCPMCRE
jgi:hypothetical protein